MAWYRTGTIAVTNGSKSVVGTGTDFLVGAAVGEGLLGPDGRIYEIDGVSAALGLSIAPAYLGATASGQSYAIVPSQSYIRDLAAQAAALINDFASVRDNAGAGKFGDGTLASPGLRFTADDNTGIRRAGNDDMRLVAAGADQAKLTSSGLFLRDDKLRITGSADETKVAMFEVDGFTTATTRTFTLPNASTTLVGTDTAQTLTNKTISGGSASGLTALSTTGNAGIGTDSPEAPLHINGVTGLLISQSMTDASTKVGRIRFKHYTNAEEPVTGILVQATASANAIFIGGGSASENSATDIIFNTGANNTTVSGSERMRINNSGNVGIGIPNPSAMLHVKAANANGIHALFGESVAGGAVAIANRITAIPTTGAAATIAWLDTPYPAGTLLLASRPGVGDVYLSATASGNPDVVINRTSGALLAGKATPTANGAKLQTVDGLTFPATQVPLSDPNTLDDYEEGTFTPTIDGTTTAGVGTYTTQLGRYTKIGNMVRFSVVLTWTAHTGTGNMDVSGLPFASTNVTGLEHAVASIGTNVALTAGNTLQSLISTNATKISLRQVPDGGGALAVIPLDTAGTIEVSGTYTV